MTPYLIVVGIGIGIAIGIWYGLSLCIGDLVYCKILRFAVVCIFSLTISGINRFLYAFA